MLRHAEMYSLLLDNYIKDPAEKDRLFHAITTVPCVKKKADWAIKWINRCDRAPTTVHKPLAAQVVQGVISTAAAAAVW